MKGRGLKARWASVARARGYNSADPNVVYWQLSMMNASGINFIVVSWWGMYPYSVGQQAPVEDAVKTLYRVANSFFPNIKIVIMVEGFNESGTYDFNYIKSYVYTNFYNAYPNENFFLNNNPRPLLCWWNQHNMTDSPANRAIIDNSSDPLFYNRIVGQSSYVDWYAWRPCSVDSNETPAINSNDGIVVIEPRYDGSHIGQGAGSVFDPTYSQELYDNQWNYVLNNTAEIKCVLIYSWNEYHERSQIEPKNDSTSIIEDPYFLLNKTKSYVEQLIPEFLPALILPIFITTTLLAVMIQRRRKARVSLSARA